MGAACFAVRRLFHTLNIDVLRVVYFVYFHSIIKHGIIFLGNSTSLFRVLTLHKRIIRIICGVAATVEMYFKNWIFYLYHVSYVFSLMVFVIDNQKNYQTNLSVHRLDTRNKNQLYLPMVNLSCFQRGLSYCAVKILSSLSE